MDEQFSQETKDVIAESRLLAIDLGYDPLRRGSCPSGSRRVSPPSLVRKQDTAD